jgi:hypothetical protein
VNDSQRATRWDIARLAHLIGWVIVAALIVFALARVFRVTERSTRLFALEALTLWLFLPAYVVLAAAALGRRGLLAAAAAVLVVAHLAWVAPDLRWWPAVARPSIVPRGTFR